MAAKAVTSEQVGVKQLLTVIEMARQGHEEAKMDSFVDCLRDVGL